MIFNPTAKNLFDEDDDEILQNIEILTGIRLKEDPNMPKHICTCCHLDLYHSMAFRERCLRAENFLHREREQQKVKHQDTLNTTAIECIIKKEAPSEVARSQHPTQRRSPRKTIKRANTSRRKPISTEIKKHPTVSSPALCGSVTKEFGISEILNMSARSATSSLRLVQCGLSTKARPKNSLSYTATSKERK
ncbi:hypothetical protein ACLKA7_008395 [Drosophila subpalustris]